ncbi:hypothetical protein V8G61_02985 [Gaetbulibacter sp. M240]|uniref:hypothetical protein n=1 Tax=Gaetbulibacter sp. M240 TaxID=3126511 RepID=UPI00374F2F0C
MTLRGFYITIFLAFTLLSCNKKNNFKDFKFSDEQPVITCKSLNNELLNEALYSFENDLNRHYSRLSGQNLTLAYSRFINGAVNNRIKLTDIASKHSVLVFQALKDEDLWDAENPRSHLNYNSPFFNCLIQNINEKQLQATLKALLETNSMSPELFGAPLASNYRAAVTDKYIALYVAFDLFYAKFFDEDLSLVNLKSDPYENVDFNKIPKK